MRCPECNNRIKSKDYDTAYEWYECSSCEGCFTPDEIVKDEVSKTMSGVVAKGKKRKSEIDADAEAIAEFEEKGVEVIKAPKAVKNRDALPFLQVVNIMGDEIQAIYEEMGGSIDEAGAQDKAMTIWREALKDGVTAREKATKVRLCKVHDG